jgi:LPS-assembly lipoprotein
MTRPLAAALCLLLLAACGFHMRGTAEVPFDVLYVPSASSGLALDLKRYILAGTKARVVDSAKDADAVLVFLGETREKVILSLTGTGSVREYQLRYRVSFRVHDGKGGEFVPSNTITLTRDITYSDTEVLAKEAEEQLLFRDMQNDMVSQIVRRLAASHKPSAA